MSGNDRLDDGNKWMLRTFVVDKSGINAAGRSTAVFLEQRMEGEAVLAWVGRRGLENEASAFQSPNDEAVCTVPGSWPTPLEQHNGDLQLSARASTG